MNTLILVAYLVGFALSILPCSRWILNAMDDGYGIDETDYALAVIIGICAATLWPFALLGVFVYRALRKPPPVSMDKK